MASVAFGVFFLVLATCSLGCDYQTSHWCSSRKIAKQCKVESQCEEFVWSRYPLSDEADQHYFEDVKPVQIGFYYEDLCPDTQDFMQNQLWPLYTAVPEIFEVDFVPYGKATEKKEGDRWVFQCQHGEYECTANIMQACALDMYPINKTFPLISCMVISGALPHTALSYCADQVGLDDHKINECSQSVRGAELEHKMALKTEGLQPQLNFVPWITLNGVHTDDIQNEALKDLLGLVCKTYQGPKPTACQKKMEN